MSTSNETVFRDRMACLDCRKAFRVRPASQWKDVDVRYGDSPRVAVCPDCGKPMSDMGADFMAPPRRSLKAWAALRVCVEAGIRFDEPGSGSLAPSTPAEARRLVQDMKDQPRKYRRE